jgi:ATP-dependent Lon protease
MSENVGNVFINQTLPVLPLRDIVVFPHMIVPLFVGRDKSIRALEESMEGDKNILLSAQKDAKDPVLNTSNVEIARWNRQGSCGGPETGQAYRIQGCG